MPRDLAPSELAWCEDIPKGISGLLEKSRDLRRAGEWTEAEQCALYARSSCEKLRNPAGCGVCLLHLADIYREEGRLGLAQSHYTESQTILKRQAPRAQRHNEAIATYGLGLTYQAQGETVDALSCYQSASTLFEEARKRWAMRNDRARERACRRAQQWIDVLTERIIGDQFGLPPTPLPVFHIWRRDGNSSPFMKNTNLLGHITVDQVLIEKQIYRIHPISDSADDLPVVGSEKANCFALPVPKEEWLVPGAQIGDYVLIRQEWTIDEERPGVVWEPDSGWIAVDFEREPDGTVRFHHRDMHIIGDLGGKVKGYAIALLKPES